MAIGKHLVGRTATCGVFDEGLVRLAGGRRTVLSLSGEPGIGKTRLLAELAARADARDQLVLRGSASELERDLPFWVFVDALDDYVHGLEPHRLDALDDETRSSLAVVLPSFARSARPAGAALHDRYRVHAAVRELLERLAAPKPLVLVLDDLHWADPASIELLGALLLRPPDAAVLMALSVRPRQMPERLSGALERARRSGSLIRIDVDALTRDEARELLGESVDSATAAVLYEESGGNPFYLEQLARALERVAVKRSVPAPGLPDLDIPPAVAADLAEELALLGDTGRLVLDGAAVAGDPFDPEIAAAAAATTEATALLAVDELLRNDLVRQTEVPRRFRFRHPIVRRAVYESSPAAWRLGAHERSAEALATRGAPAPERAHHVERSARPGDTNALAVLREAGDALAHRAPTTAAHWFSVALGLLPEQAPTPERIELLLAHAGALTTSGQFAEARCSLVETIRLVPDDGDGVALRVRLTTACAGVEHLLGRHEEAHDRLAAALKGLKEPVSREAVALMLELAVDGLLRMEYEQMRDWARRALLASRALRDGPLTAAGVALLAWACGLVGDLTESEAYRTEAAALIDAMPDAELAFRLDAATSLAGAELYLDHFEACGVHAERAVRIARATGQPAFVPTAFMVLAWARMLRGRLTEGGGMLDDALDDARLLGNGHTLVGLLLNRSLTALAAGDLDLAVSTAKESVELTRGMDKGLYPAAAALALAASLLETGDPGLEGAVMLLLERAGGPGLSLMPGASFRAKWLELLTRCFLALGGPAAARRAAASAEAAAVAGANLLMAKAMSRRASAAVELELGDVTRAAELALASATAADGAGIPIEAALSRTLAGRALAKAGRPGPAVAELERAAAAFEACGAVRYRSAADQELRRLGRRVHRRTRRGVADAGLVASLTEREAEVARLVVDRQTNPQIAESLFVSSKTVETHMHNIFNKLGVSSRVEVARAVEQAGPQPPW